MRLLPVLPEEPLSCLWGKMADEALQQPDACDERAFDRAAAEADRAAAEAADRAGDERAFDRGAAEVDRAAAERAFDRAAAEAERAGLELRRGAEGLVLSDGHMELCADFSRMAPRLRPSNLHRELVVRAAKLKPAGGRGGLTADGRGDLTPGGRDDLTADGWGGPTACERGDLTAGGRGGLTAVDATAGLGEDSLLLAAAGFDIVLYERNPVIAALLRDALERAAGVAELAGAVSRMRLVEADSMQTLPRLDFVPDVVILDPMFPAKQKSAHVKKKLQILQRLEEPCDDEGALLDAAIAAKPRKIVVKRPVKGPLFAERTPSYSISGKAVRYDVIVR